MPVLDIDDIAIAYDDVVPLARDGAAPARAPLLLLHGAVQTRMIWEAQVAAVAGRRRVVAPDLRGHGQTPSGERLVTIGRLSDDAVSLMDRLGVGRAVVCGVSLGGMVALDMAARHPERVAGLVLANTPTALSSRAWLRRLVDRLDPQDLLPLAFRILGRRATARLGLAIAGRVVGPHWVGRTARRHFLRGFTVMREEAIVAIYRAIVEAEPTDPALVRCPVLLVDGRDDAPSISAQMEAVAAGARRARLVRLRAGHVAPLDDPDGFNRRLLAFLDTLERRAAA